MQVIPFEIIARKIYLFRGQKVMQDSDLAELYDVETKVLNQSIKRNMERFPENFMFQLSEDEYSALRSQIVTLKRGQHRKYLPYVFTEHGIIMLSSVLNSPKAVQVSIAIVNAFIKMREYLATHKQILEKLEKHDKNFVLIFKVLEQLTVKPKEVIPKKQIGFKP